MTETLSGGALRPARRLWLRVALAAVIACAASVGAWFVSLDRGLDAMSRAGATRIAFFVDALDKDINRYKLLAKTLSETAAARGRRSDLAGLTARAAAISGAASVRFLTVESTDNPAAQLALSQAYQGVMGLGFDPAEQGTLIVAAPVWDGEVVVGAVAAWVNAPDLEFAWRSLADVLFFASEGGEVRLSSLAALRGRYLEDIAPEMMNGYWLGQVLWRTGGKQWRALGFDVSEKLVITRPAPVVDMTAHMLIDTRPARRAALLAALAVGASVFAISLLAVIALQRRAALRQRLAIEARAMARLEDMVEARTQELRDAQDSLVQAGKISALGQMAAGIAHELNQPLTAIRTYADNGAVLLDRDRTGEVRANLTEIASLTARAARIIQTLRAFARNAPEQTVAAPIGQVVEDALALIAGRLRDEGADVRFVPPSPQVFVMGGIVRLQQVVLNILGNALDAQAGSAGPVIDIALATHGDDVLLSIRDHGPGMTDTVRDRVFDPFFSTKTEGGEGMGLGLSISYGIIRSFGGDLTASNHPDGGAVFTVRLSRARDVAVAA